MLSPFGRILLAAALMGFVTACAGPRMDGARPAGFTVAATVYPPATITAPPAHAERARRPARYVIETDGVLRMAAAPTVGTPAATFPPGVRRLSPWQMDELWRLAVQARLLDARHPGAAPPPAYAARHTGAPTAVFETTADFSPRIVVVVLDDGSPEAIAAAALLDHIAHLAWIEP